MNTTDYLVTYRGSYAVLNSGLELFYDGAIFNLYYPNDCLIKHLSSLEARAMLHHVKKLVTSQGQSISLVDDDDTSPPRTPPQTNQHETNSSISERNIGDILQEMGVGDTYRFVTVEDTINVQRVNHTSWVAMSITDEAPTTIMAINEMVAMLECRIGNRIFNVVAITQDPVSTIIQNALITNLLQSI
jgi:hypothetical protein